MYRLMEVVYANSESIAIYPTQGQEPFADEVALLAEYETKLGADMKDDAYKAGFLMAFDDNGKVYANKCFFKDAVTLKHRLVWATTTESGTVIDQKACTDIMDVEAELHKKRGAGMKDAFVKAILTIGTNGSDVIFNKNWVRPITTLESEPTEPTE